MRIPTALLMLVTVAPLAACQSSNSAADEVKTVGIEVLPNIPFPPDGVMLTSQTTSEAMHVIMSTDRSVDSVVTYYRDLLAKEPFRLVNETTTPEGVTSFFVEQDGPGLWLTVQKNGESGAMVTITGAVTDTAAVNKAKREAMTRPVQVVEPGGRKPN